MFGEYFWPREGSRKLTAFAWTGLVVVVSHSAFTAWQKARINAWYGSFYNLLQTSGDAVEFSSGQASPEALPEGARSVRYALVEFLVIVLPSIAIHPLAKFVRSHWTLQWRLAIMKSYFRIWNPSNMLIEGASQRLQEDTVRFAKGCDTCMVVLLDSISTLIVFVPVLGALSHEVTPPVWLSWAHSWWLVALAFGAAFLAVVVSACIGRALLYLEVNNQKVEADLRKSLVLLETSPAMECAGDASTEDDLSSDPGAPTPLHRPVFDRLWEDVRSNYALLYHTFLYLNLWLTSFDQLLIVTPYILVAPLLFYSDDRRVTMGVLVKLSDSFGKVFGSFSVIAESWVAINEFASAVIRLREFEEKMSGHTKGEHCSSQLVTKEIARSDNDSCSLRGP